MIADAGGASPYDPDVLTLAQAALELGVRPASLRAAANRGTLRARRVGRDWVVRRVDVEAYRRDHLGRVGRPPKTSA